MTGLEWAGFAVGVLLFALIGLWLRERFQLAKARKVIFLLRHNWTTSHCPYSEQEFNHWRPADLPHYDFNLESAFKRQTMINEHERLGLPIHEATNPEPGGWQHDSPDH